MTAGRWLFVLLPLAGFGAGFAAARQQPPPAAPIAPLALVRPRPQIIPAVAPVPVPPPLLRRKPAPRAAEPVDRVARASAVAATVGVDKVAATGAREPSVVQAATGARPASAAPTPSVSGGAAVARPSPGRRRSRLSRRGSRGF
jgi:hypothetical protein